MTVCFNCNGAGYKLEELKFGLRNITCPSCLGSGNLEPPMDKMKLCPDCNGLGYYYADAEGFNKGFISSKTRCKKCDGKGMV